MKKNVKIEGFTLIEVILVVALIGIVFVPLLGIYVNHTRVLKKINIRKEALNLAHERMEEVLAVPYEDLEGEEEDYFTISIDGYPEFERKVTVSGGAESGLKEIEVIVYWDNRGKSVTFKSQITGREG